jgi:hypothetical protein
MHKNRLVMVLQSSFKVVFVLIVNEEEIEHGHAHGAGGHNH